LFEIRSQRGAAYQGKKDSLYAKLAQAHCGDFHCYAPADKKILTGIQSYLTLPGIAVLSLVQYEMSLKGGW
jgi:hypothetical protein